MANTKRSKIRDSARGEVCTLQLHPYCNGNPDTTVLCHLPSEFHGMALKSPDWWAVYACSSCHDVIDQRNPMALRELGREEVQLCMFRALYRTQRILQEKGFITVTGSIG